MIRVRYLVTVVLAMCALWAFAGWMAMRQAGAAERSGQWRAVRSAYIDGHATCEACGFGGDKDDLLEVHHVLDFRLFPEKELDSTNLITLCPRCHLVFGHLGDWKAFNPCVREDAARHWAQVKARPYSKKDAIAFLETFATNAP